MFDRHGDGGPPAATFHTAEASLAVLPPGTDGLLSYDALSNFFREFWPGYCRACPASRTVVSEQIGGAPPLLRGVEGQVEELAITFIVSRCPTWPRCLSFLYPL